MVPEMLGRRH